MEGVPVPKKRPIEERFWEKVDKRGDDECWIWLGATIQPGAEDISNLRYTGK